MWVNDISVNLLVVIRNKVEKINKRTLFLDTISFIGKKMIVLYSPHIK